MKTLNKFAAFTLTVALAATATSCHIYKKFEMPSESALGADYVQAKAQEVDSTALGNLPWQQVLHLRHREFHGEFPVGTKSRRSLYIFNATCCEREKQRCVY